MTMTCEKCGYCSDKSCRKPCVGCGQCRKCGVLLEPGMCRFEPKYRLCQKCWEKKRAKK